MYSVSCILCLGKRHNVIYLTWHIVSLLLGLVWLSLTAHWHFFHINVGDEMCLTVIDRDISLHGQTDCLKEMLLIFLNYLFSDNISFFKYAKSFRWLQMCSLSVCSLNVSVVLRFKWLHLYIFGGFHNSNTFFCCKTIA